MKRGTENEQRHTALFFDAFVYFFSCSFQQGTFHERFVLIESFFIRLSKKNKGLCNSLAEPFPSFL